MSSPILEKCRDLWTNTFDYFWMLDGKVFSPYFSNADDARKWLNEMHNKSNDSSLRIL
jgi:hypothetical protein